MIRVLAMFLLMLTPIASWSQSQWYVAPGVDGDRVAPPAALLGAWGSAEQCAAAPGETPAAAHTGPLHIDREWLRQGGIYCYLSWRASYALDDASETHALAQCGEDTLREYRIVLRLHQSGLRIRWSESFSTALLSRCD